MKKTIRRAILLLALGMLLLCCTGCVTGQIYGKPIDDMEDVDKAQGIMFGEKIIQIMNEGTLEELNEASNERVTSGLAEIKQQKEETTAANRESLTALTQQLPYTRLGSLAYTEAYQFMVSPTTIEERDSKKTAQADINVQGANEPPAVQNEGVLETKDDSIAGFLYLLLAAAAGVAIILVARIAMQSNRVK